jgi:LuxR family maltose regulon positive regulatory protein
MARLIHEVAGQGVASSYIGRLLAAFSGHPSQQARQPSRADDIIEPLSKRELSVLQFLADGLSNKQIATQLYLSLSTIKFHTSNIYGKLGVKSRTEALVRARTLGLLSL